MLNLRDHGAAPGAPASQNLQALNTAISMLPQGGAIYVPTGSYRLNGPAHVAFNDVAILGETGAELFWENSGNGLTVRGNRFRLEKLKLRNWSNTNGARLLEMIGAATSNRLDGLTILDCEFSHTSGHGVLCQFVNNIRIHRSSFHDIGYAGAMFVSCDHGWFQQNRIVRIGPGAQFNMYGVSLTHDSTNYASDPYAGTRYAKNPFCALWWITDNYVEEINWEGIDGHGGYFVHIVNNVVMDTKLGISCSQGSGGPTAASDYAGGDIWVVGNNVEASGAFANTGYGINVSGGGKSFNQNVWVLNNRIVNKGLTDQHPDRVAAGKVTNFAGLLAYHTRRLKIIGNEFQGIGDAAIYKDAEAEDLVIKDNVFNGLSLVQRGVSTCIYDGSNEGGHWIEGNIICRDGNVPNFLYFNTGTTVNKPLVIRNNNLGLRKLPEAVHPQSITHRDNWQ